MDKLKKNMVFYLLLLIDFNIVPWFIKNTGSAMIVIHIYNISATVQFSKKA